MTKDSMFTLKRTFLLLLTLHTSALFAGVMGPAQQKPAWRVGAQALYLQPSLGGNGLGYSTFSNYGVSTSGNLVNTSGATNNLSNINPQWGWGFQVEAGYQLHAKSDLNVNWYHFQKTRRDLLPSGTLFAGSASGLYAGLLRVAPRWDAINVEFGQRLEFDEVKALRLHVGVNYTSLYTQFTNYPQLNATGSALFATTDKISYNGFGPRFGGDFSYAFQYHVSAYGKAAASLLVGHAKQFVAGYPNVSVGGTTYLYSTGNYSQAHNSVVVPELEGKLGLTLDRPIKNGYIKFDLGYLWINYFNTLISQVGANVTSSAIGTTTTTNFSLNGFYFGAVWTGEL